MTHSLLGDLIGALRPDKWNRILDESGFAQRPPIRATWAPQGRTPVVREPFNWQHLSAIGAVLTTPTGWRPRWVLAVHRGAIRGPLVARFLTALRRHRRKRVILLWDRLPAHRSRRVAAALQRHRSLRRPGPPHQRGLPRRLRHLVVGL
jgi:hypothetical protein